ncbi:N-acetyltransferase [Ideonella sp. 4Y16]|uniref:N-acetyltransferase n=1 Tax=Ideonella alba TaxID=2824118 RepID=A0A940YB84_9BURK|nr:GNAT family N-acetyltransferase [Ideonella alba]MBQ0932353.1 N-acetyltransferase [Ideonella alba]MBQ0944503.1 N-acetyltransferase [Ideonella alba]
MSDPVFPPPEPATRPEAHAPAFRWVPIRSLSERQRPRVLTHLLGLEGHDRYLRFGYAANDAQIGRYVDLLDFRRDEVFGVFNRRLELIAMAHLAYLPDVPGERPMAEFGVSVSPQARGRGFGARLFDHAVLHARNRHIDTLIIHALSENTAMLRIARNAGATLEREGGEAEARLKLPSETVGSHFEELIEEQAAELNYGLKQGARTVDALLGLIQDVKDGIARVRRSTIE